MADTKRYPKTNKVRTTYDKEKISFHKIFLFIKLFIERFPKKLKGKSALMIFDRHPEYRDKYGRHFWARGYYAETIGQVNEDTIKKYIEEQEECSRIEG